MVLFNKTNRMKVYTLSHNEVCDAECLCTPGKHLQTVLDTKTGNKGVREVSVLVPMSVHIPGGGTSAELPLAVLKSKKIAADRAAGLLIVKGN